MKTILIADDDFTIGMQIEEMLTALGYEVVGQAGSGQEAVEMARDLKPDIIIMDVVMPGKLNGIKAAEKIKAQWDIPIVFISGHGESEFIQEAKQTEPFGYVMKPFDESEIKAFVEIALHKHKMEKRLKDAHEQLERTNHHLQESEQRYRRLAENSPDMIYRMSLPEGKYEYVSPAATTIFGYAPEAWYDNSFLFRGIIHSDSHSYFAVQWQSLLKGHVPPTYEYKIIHKDKSVRWINQRNILIKDDNGRPEAIEGIVTDITERKRTEMALEKQNAFVEGLLETMPSPVFYKNREGVYTGCNQAFEEFVGKDRKEIIGRTVYEVYNLEQAHITQRFKEKDDELFERGGKQRYEWKFPGQKGIRQVIFDKAVIPGLEGQPEGIIGIITDITEQTQIEETLRESEEKLRIIFNTVYSGIILVNADGIITFANRRMAEMLGRNMEELIGSSYPEHVHETQSQEGEEKMHQLIRGEIDNVFLERLYRKKDGTVFRGHLSGSRLCHLDGSFSSLVGVITDIQEKRSPEDKLQHAERPI